MKEKGLKKRFNSLEIIILCFLIVLLLIPLGLSFANIVVDKNKVRITTIYVGDITLINANITNSTGDALYQYPSTMEASKTYENGDTTFIFKDRASDGWYFYLDEGDYTFSISGRNQFGKMTIHSEDFTVDLTPCDDNNDGIILPGEECDSYDLSEETCESLGFAFGTLACSDCRFDTSACQTCAPNVCSICDNKVCSADGKAWDTTNYTRICGAGDSDFTGIDFVECTPGKCDLSVNKVCNENNYWTTTGFCNACSGRDSSCPGTCISGSCDIGTGEYCSNGAWGTPPSQETYCYYCKDFDSECTGCTQE